MRSQLLIATLWLLTLVLAFLWGRMDSVQQDKRPGTPSEATDPRPGNASQPVTPAAPAEVVYLPAETAPFAHLQALLKDFGHAYMNSLLHALSDEELVSLFKQEGGLVTDDGKYQYRMDPLLKEWARRDPQAAWQYAESLPSGYPKQDAKSTVMEGWAQSDLDGAWEAAKLVNTRTFSQKPEIPDNLTQRMIASKVGTEATEQILEKIAAMENSTNRNSTYKALINAFLYKEDYDGALELLKKIPDETVVDDALYHDIPEHWSHTEPAKAAEWAKQFVDDETMDRILRNWGNTNPKGALEWSLANQQLHESAIQETIGIWAQIDRAELETWLISKINNPPPGGLPRKFTDSFNTAMIELYVYNDPQAALPYADAISDEEKRTTELSRVYSRWYTRDPISAEAYGLENGHFDHISDMVPNYLLRPGNITTATPAE